VVFLTQNANLALEETIPKEMAWLVHGQLRLLDQLHHRKQGLSILGREMNQCLGVVLADLDRVSLRRFSPFFRVSSPILSKSGLRSAATSNGNSGTLDFASPSRSKAIRL
jgi:hypothetical protein